jgi:hypothetical protein
MSRDFLEVFIGFSAEEKEYISDEPVNYQRSRGKNFSSLFNNLRYIAGKFATIEADNILSFKPVSV